METTSEKQGRILLVDDESAILLWYANKVSS